jgi:redox-sensing transcriptional repressor
MGFLLDELKPIPYIVVSDFTKVGGMATKIKIPVTTVNRMSLYLRVFSQIEKAGSETISSRELAELSGINPAQVRKDLAYFGQFGRRGVGYAVVELKKQIRSILGLDRQWNAVIIGAGRLGQALMVYPGFGAYSFNMAAAFDSDPDKIGWELEGVRIHDLADFGKVAKEKRVEIAILAVPAQAAQEVANLVVAAKVPAILNFAPAYLSVPQGTMLRNVDFASELEALTYFLQKT